MKYLLMLIFLVSVLFLSSCKSTRPYDLDKSGDWVKMNQVIVRR